MNRLDKKLIGALLALSIVIGMLPIVTVHAEVAEPLFSVGKSTNLTLSDALDAVNGSGTIIMTQSGTLVGGEYVIPSNVTLLLPYEAGKDTVNVSTHKLPYANSASVDSVGTAAMPGDSTTNLLLTLNGATFNVLGKIVLGGKFSSVANKLSGQTCNAHSDIKLLNGASIIVEDGGILSAVGYIFDDGLRETSVKVMEGGKIYQPFVVADYGGGTYTKDAFYDDVSPFNRYSMMNIQVPIYLEYGSEMYGYCDLHTPTTGTHNTTTARIVGYNSSEKDYEALLRMKNGYATFVYDQSVQIASNQVGKSEIAFYGDVVLGSLSLTIKYLIFTIPVTTKDVLFPVPYNISYRQVSGTFTIPSDIGVKILPGAVVTIEDDASLDVHGKLIAYDGSQMVSIVYPNGQTLSAGGYYEERATLLVNGQMNVLSSASIGGKIETMGSGCITVQDGATLSLSSNEGVSSGRTTHKLDASLIIHEDRYSTNSWEKISTGTYYGISDIARQEADFVYNEKTVNYSNAGKPWMNGTWSMNRLLFDDGISTVGTDDPSNWTIDAGKILKKYSDANKTIEISENPAQGVVYYEFVDCNHVESMHTEYDVTEKTHSFTCTICDGQSAEIEHSFGENFKATENGHVYKCVCEAEQIQPHEWGEDGACTVTGCGWETVQINTDEGYVVISNMDLEDKIVIVACYETSKDKQGKMVSCDMCGVQEAEIAMDASEEGTKTYIFTLAGLEEGMKVSIFILDNNYCPEEYIEKIA